MKGQSILIGTVLAQAAVTFAYKQAEENRDYKVQRYMVDNCTVSPRGVLRDGKYHTLVTSIFSHFDWEHLAFNSLGMYTFGMSTLAHLGPARFIALFMGGGLVSSLAFVAWPSVIPKSWPARYSYNTNSNGLGASGAVNALIMWSILKQPQSTIFVMGLLPVPAVLCGVGMIAYDALGLYEGSGNIGNASHLSGAAFGALFFMLTRRFRYY